MKRDMCILPPDARRQRGLSLVELVMFIVVVSVGVAGILLVLNYTTASGADPMVQKQALAIAESLLDEIELMPHTFCDPDDPQARTAQSATVGPTGCSAAGMVEGSGPSGETRYAAPQYDNVIDYNGYNTAAEIPAGMKDITGAPLTGLSAYNAAVAISTPAAFGGIPTTDANGQANVLRIVVTVTGPANTTVTLEGYRAKYAPNAVP